MLDDDERPAPLTPERLTELRRTVPHATLASIGAEAKEGADPEVIEDLQAYFHRFAAPTGGKDDGHPCLRCGERLTGMLATLLGKGGFERGLAHGHGHCRCCGWPATVHHFIKDRHGKELMTVHNIILQAHPDDVDIRKKSRAA